MSIPVYTRQFQKDIRRLKKRGKDLEKIKFILRSLAASETLDALHRDRSLAGAWAGRRECHRESEWLLIYKLTEDRIIFERTGTHADLFRK